MGSYPSETQHTHQLIYLYQTHPKPYPVQFTKPFCVDPPQHTLFFGNSPTHTRSLLTLYKMLHLKKTNRLSCSMASSPLLLICSTFLLFTISTSHTSHNNPLILPIRKDGGTLQYITQIDQKTPNVPINLVVDLGGRFLWVDNESSQVSSSHRLIQHRSIQCSNADSSVSRPGCETSSSTTSCSLLTENTITGMSITGELAEDIVTIRSVQGSTSTVNSFLFTSAPTFLLHGLASGTKGMAGLGMTRIALPSQLSQRLGLDRKFTICLPSSKKQSNGFIVFGNFDASKSLMYTPLITSVGDLSHEYFIGVKFMKINGKLILINKEDIRGTKLSTTVPYTTLETPIFNTFTKAFMKASISFNMTRVASVAPFDMCFNSRNIAITHNGPVVPIIDLVLQSDMVKWTLNGGSSMVPVSEDVMCLGFIDGGLNTVHSIVIGGYQLEDQLIEFDLASLRMGFSSHRLDVMS